MRVLRRKAPHLPLGPDGHAQRKARMLIAWFVLVGAVLIVMAFSSHLVQRLPLSPAIVYLCVGAATGRVGLGLIDVDPMHRAGILELLTEIAVLITLFAVGLRLRMPFTWAAWELPVRLATVGMVLTTALIALAGWLLLDVPPAAALLLGAVLAPTDPVLASDVQIREAGDRDAVRVSLTAEGGINDGTAFPAVMLALGLLGTHELGAFGWRWVAVDLVWAIAAGLLLGWWCGVWVGRTVLRLRGGGHRLEYEEFLVFGVIALVYGVALALHAYGFLAVFAAGAGLAHAERRGRVRKDAEDDAGHSSRLSSFSGQCERLAEVAIVLLIGATLAWVSWEWQVLVFAALVLVVARPLAVLAVLPRRRVTKAQRRLMAWFGIRGVGSVYYLSYAAGHQLDPAWTHTVASAVFLTIAMSICLHGVSATPLMERYRRRRQPKDEPAPRREGL
ncbi:cation:proton antiporter [Ideonella sp. BN130291]|uniref:cation:proton antiporter n=1 Tax=Ideonella sp. BN130291 TaxID=3112940 RepID=UPI002E257F25|nr:sodium:proton antiporter [Ideonella sp. BN130291]